MTKGLVAASRPEIEAVFAEWVKGHLNSNAPAVEYDDAEYASASADHFIDLLAQVQQTY